MNLFLFYDTLMNVTQLLEANVVVSKHVEKHDSERVNIGLEIVGPLLTPLCKLLGCCKPQCAHICCHWFKKRRAVQIHFRFHLGRVLLYLQEKLGSVFMKIL